MYKILIVSRTSDTTASLLPSEFQTDNPKAAKAFVKRFNKDERHQPQGRWAVLALADKFAKALEADAETTIDDDGEPVHVGDGLCDDLAQPPGVFPF